MPRGRPENLPPRGGIRPRGDGFQVRVHAGINPESGQAHYLAETCDTEWQAEDARIRLVALVDAGEAPLTDDEFAALRRWLDSRQAEVAAGDLALKTLHD